jgi:hypothetical protein
MRKICEESGVTEPVPLQAFLFEEKSWLEVSGQLVCSGLD